MKKLFNTIFLVITLFFFYTTLSFSYCFSGSLEEEYDMSSQVFTGEVIKIDFINNKEVNVVFKTEKQYKGGKTPEISLMQPICGYRPHASCYEDSPIVFEKGKKYLVYASDSHGQYPLHVGTICSWTKLLSDAEKDIKALEEIASDPNWKFEKKSYEK